MRGEIGFELHDENLPYGKFYVKPLLPYGSGKLPHGNENSAMLGKKLRDARKARKLTLEEVAPEIGISLSQLSRIESGKRLARAHEVQKLAALYKVQMSDLTSGIDAPAPDPIPDVQVPEEPGKRWVQISDQLASVLELVREIAPEEEGQVVGFVRGLISAHLGQKKIPSKDPDQGH